MACNDIRKHLIAAEEELRLAFVESLENRYDDNLSMLVECLNSVKDVIACTPVRGTDNINDYYRKKAEYDFNLDTKVGGDLDALDNVINFPTGEVDLSGLENIKIDTSSADGSSTVTFTPEPGVWGDDIITFGDTKNDKDDPA